MNSRCLFTQENDVKGRYEKDLGLFNEEIGAGDNGKGW